ncbi:MAG: hypothetical protein Q4B82_05710 [Alysiella sp.]|uniref:hypothetical protein n=1 Tax=Alysiella sp. TaxID=1872483 RepID=UPI0026DC9F24|nr:hypothetical protein [Alysiella sp.]MDO4434060.1 hypothetical protein [Alysiella sp.]
MNKVLLAFATVLLLNACAWEFGTNEQGRTQIRQKYPMGTGIYHTEGAASQNTLYHNGRPQQHAIVPQKDE